MAHYAKLWSGITESSLWGASKDARLLFVTMLAKADSTGFVEASLPGLARIANLTREETESALEILSTPDPDSKSDTAEGRRVAKVPGGFCVVNFEDYRGRESSDVRRAYMRDYMHNWRKQKTVNNPAATAVNNPSVNVNTSECQLTQGEGEGEGEGERERKKPARQRALTLDLLGPVVTDLWSCFNAARIASIPGARAMAPTDGSTKLMRERLEAGESPEAVRHVIAVYAAEAKDPAKAMHFNATTPFRPEPFARALSQPLPANKIASDPTLFPEGMTPHESPATARTLHREAVERGYANHGERLVAEGRA